MSGYLAHRREWIAIVTNPGTDRSIGGRLNRNERSVERLTEILANHENLHIQILRKASVRRGGG